MLNLKEFMNKIEEYNYNDKKDILNDLRQEIEFIFCDIKETSDKTVCYFLCRKYTSLVENFYNIKKEIEGKEKKEEIND